MESVQREGRRIVVRMLVNDILLGGAQVMAAELASALDTSQFDVAYWYLYSKDGKAHRETIGARIDISSLSICNLDVRGFIKGINTVAKTLRQERVNILHCHLPDAVIVGGIAAVFTDVPFVIHEHQSRQYHSWKIRLAYWVLRRFASLTICYAGAIEKEIAGEVHMLTTPPQRLAYQTYTISNGIDIDRVNAALTSAHQSSVRSSMGFSKSDLVIISIARLVEWKGHRQLIDAFGRIASHIPSARLCIVGEGPFRSALQMRIRELGLENRIILMGAAGNVYDLLAASTIFSLVFSHPKHVYGDAIGIAGLEGMATGLPVIIGAYRDAERYVHNNETGLIIAPYDEAALADALTVLLEDSRLRDRLGQAARAFVLENLSWNAIIPVYEALYHLLAHA